MLIVIFHMKMNGKIVYGGCSYMEKYVHCLIFARISQIHRLDASLCACEIFVHITYICNLAPIFCLWYICANNVK